MPDSPATTANPNDEPAEAARERGPVLPSPYATRPLPRLATFEPPGSEAKVLVMQARWAAGEGLFHPDDAGHGGQVTTTARPPGLMGMRPVVARYVRGIGRVLADGTVRQATRLRS